MHFKREKQKKKNSISNFNEKIHENCIASRYDKTENVPMAKMVHCFFFSSPCITSHFQVVYTELDVCLCESFPYSCITLFIFVHCGKYNFIKELKNSEKLRFLSFECNSLRKWYLQTILLH